MVENESEEKVSETVQNVVRDSGGPVGESGAGTAGYQVGDGAECTEHKSKETGYDGPENGRIHFLERKDNKSQNTPDIQITAPPDAEPENNSFQKREGINYGENAFLIDQRV